MKTDIGQATEMRRGSVPPVPFRRSRLSTRSLRPSLITHSDVSLFDFIAYWLISSFVSARNTLFFMLRIIMHTYFIFIL